MPLIPGRVVRSAMIGIGRRELRSFFRAGALLGRTSASRPVVRAATRVPVAAPAQHHGLCDLDGDVPSWLVTLSSFLMHVVALKGDRAGQVSKLGRCARRCGAALFHGNLRQIQEFRLKLAAAASAQTVRISQLMAVRQTGHERASGVGGRRRRETLEVIVMAHRNGRRTAANDGALSQSSAFSITRYAIAAAEATCVQPSHQAVLELMHGPR